MEPRYQRQEEQREARRQASHEQRRQQLLEQQHPFGFEERAAERAQRRQLLHGDVPGKAPASTAAGSGQPATPTFHAQPVPLSTLEVCCVEQGWGDGVAVQGYCQTRILGISQRCRSQHLLLFRTHLPLRHATPCWPPSSSCSTTRDQPQLRERRLLARPAAFLLLLVATQQLRQRAGRRSAGLEERQHGTACSLSRHNLLCVGG